ncbi:MAG: hypothetical protein HRT74_10710, partial [Flavobacteriales bacterium]|nr:hypothetical protein [Flavobacteriales bacterium]
AAQAAALRRVTPGICAAEVHNAAKAVEIVDEAKKHFPHLEIIARTDGWADYYEMIEKDILGVYREFSDGALRMGAHALEHMGLRKYRIQRALKKFRQHDEEFLKELAKSRHESTLISKAKSGIEDIELLMLDDMENEAAGKDLGWDTDTIKKEFVPLFDEKEEGKG